MRPDTRHPDNPTLKDWALTLAALTFVLFVPEALAALVDLVVTP